MAIVSSIAASVSVGTTPASIAALLRAINPNAPTNVTSLKIEGDPNQTADVLIGANSQVSSSNYGARVNGASAAPISVHKFQEEDRSHRNSVSLERIFLVAASGTQTVHIYVRVY